MHCWTSSWVTLGLADPQCLSSPLLVSHEVPQEEKDPSGEIHHVHSNLFHGWASVQMANMRSLELPVLVHAQNQGPHGGEGDSLLPYS